MYGFCGKANPNRPCCGWSRGTVGWVWARGKVGASGSVSARRVMGVCMPARGVQGLRDMVNGRTRKRW